MAALAAMTDWRPPGPPTGTEPVGYLASGMGAGTGRISAAAGAPQQDRVQLVKEARALLQEFAEGLADVSRQAAALDVSVWASMHQGSALREPLLGDPQATQQEEEDRLRSQGHPGRGLRVLETQEEVRRLLSGRRVLHVKGFGSGFGDPAREPSVAERRQDETAAQAVERFRPDYLVVDGDPWGSGFQRYVKAYADRQAGAGLAVPELVWVKNVKGSSPTPEEREKRLGQAREWADQGLPVVVSWLPEVSISEGVDRLFGAGCWERLQGQKFDFRGAVRLLEVPAPQQPVWLRALRGTAPGREMFKAIEAVESRAGKQYFEKCSFENAAKGNAIYQHLRGAGPKPAAQGAVSFGGGESVLLEFATLYLFPGSGFDAEQAALFAFGRGRPDDPALPAHEGRAFRSQATAKRAPGANPGVRAALLRAAAAAKIHDMTEERAGPVASSPGAGAPSEQSSRYTSSLLSLQLQQYARRGRPPPALCPCVPQPSRAPCAGSDGYVSPDPAWEAYVQKVALPASHAYNCELSRGPQQLQRQVLMMSRGE